MLKNIYGWMSHHILLPFEIYLEAKNVKIKLNIDFITKLLILHLSHLNFSQTARYILMNETLDQVMKNMMSLPCLQAQ